LNDSGFGIRVEPVGIFDDAVVRDGDARRLVEVRVGVLVRRRAVRGPAGVADADAALDGLGGDEPGEALVNLALLLAGEQFGVTKQRHAGAVVAAVFQPPQAVEENGSRLLLADVADDAAHKGERDA
jgi:hypothetical protein